MTQVSKIAGFDKIEYRIYGSSKLFTQSNYPYSREIIFNNTTLDNLTLPISNDYTVAVWKVKELKSKH